MHFTFKQSQSATETYMIKADTITDKEKPNVLEYLLHLSNGLWPLTDSCSNREGVKSDCPHVQQHKPTCG